MAAEIRKAAVDACKLMPMLTKSSRWFRSLHSDRQDPAIRGHVPFRVCLPVYGHYETDNRVIRYAQALADRGDHVEVLAVGTTASAPFSRIRGVDVYRIVTGKIGGTQRLSYMKAITKFFWKAFVHITKGHLKKPYDLIHVHSVPDFLVLAAAIPKISGSKIILDIHDIVPEFYASKFTAGQPGFIFRVLTWIERLSCRFSDHVITSNHLWLETIASRSAKKGNCSVVLNYPDEEMFHVRPGRVRDDKIILIYPGTLAYHQGLDLAIQAFDVVKNDAPGLEFHIYGTGPARAQLSDLIQSLNLSDQVFLKDEIPFTQIAEAVSAADIGIVPKRNDPFGGSAFSTKILEFMAAGIPVIAAETRIDRFYFNESVVKFFKPDDISDLARCMRSLIADKDERRRIARNALSFVEEFRWGKHKAAYYELVDGLLSESPPRERDKIGR